MNRGHGLDTSLVATCNTCYQTRWLVAGTGGIQNPEPPPHACRSTNLFYGFKANIVSTESGLASPNQHPSARWRLCCIHCANLQGPTDDVIKPNQKPSRNDVFPRPDPPRRTSSSRNKTSFSGQYSHQGTQCHRPSPIFLPSPLLKLYLPANTNPSHRTYPTSWKQPLSRSALSLLHPPH